MKSFENILVTRNYRDHQHIALIQLNRPKVLNALSTDLMKDLVEALFLLEDDRDIRVIVLTGSDRAFAAGADIGQMAEASPIDQINDNRFRTWKQLSLITKPVIAAVNGFALGGGCELAMSCDFIIAGDSARFGQPEIKIGTIPGAGGTQRLTRAVGKSKTMLAVLTGEMLDAYEAERAGLVAKVVPAETLLQETFEIAKVIANRAPVAVKLAKEAVNMAFESSLKDGMEYERRNFYLTFSSKDQKEGMKAFLERENRSMKGTNLLLLLALFSCSNRPLKPKTIKQSLDSRERQFQQCYMESDSYLSPNAPLKGLVRMTFTIVSDGSIENEKIDYTDYKDPNMHACMLGQLREIEFAPPPQAEDGGIINVTKELTFERRRALP